VPPTDKKLSPYLYPSDRVHSEYHVPVPKLTSLESMAINNIPKLKEYDRLYFTHVLFVSTVVIKYSFVVSSYK
jgi:hypothetical protein